MWELVEAHEGAENSVGRSALLAGCVDAVRWEQGKAKTGEAVSEESYQHTEMMAKVNLAVVSRIAGMFCLLFGVTWLVDGLSFAANIFASESLEQHFAFVLEKLQDGNAYARALAYLVCRALLPHFSGAPLVDAAHRVVGAMGIKTLDGMDEFMRGTDNLQVVSASRRTVGT